MLKNYNDKDLQEKNIACQYYVFVQVWRELTERKTMDSYQYRLMNTLSIMRELDRLLEYRLAQLVTNNTHINECREEAFDIIKKDYVLKSCFPAIYRRLLSHLSKSPNKEHEMRLLKNQIQYCFNLIKDEYLSHSLLVIKGFIDNKETSEIIRVADAIVSVCVDSGWDIIALKDVVCRLENSLDYPEETWAAFCDTLRKRQQEEYIVYIPIRISPRLKAGDMRGTVYNDIAANTIEVRCGHDLAKVENYLIEFKRDENYAVIKEYAYDYYSASRSALEKYSNALNLLSFYGMVKPWNWANWSWDVVNVSSKNHKKLSIKQLYNTYDYIEGMKQLYKNAMELERNSSGVICERLRAVYKYVNVGKSTYSQEIQFMNIWVALESLCRTQCYASIIGNVLDTVPYALCRRYIYINLL